MQTRSPIRTTVAVAATALAVALLPAFSASSATAPNGPSTAAISIPTCTHDFLIKDGVLYKFVKHETLDIGIHLHYYNVFLLSLGLDLGRHSRRC